MNDIKQSKKKVIMPLLFFMQSFLLTFLTVIGFLLAVVLLVIAFSYLGLDDDAVIIFTMIILAITAILFKKIKSAKKAGHKTIKNIFNY